MPDLFPLSCRIALSYPAWNIVKFYTLSFSSVLCIAAICLSHNSNNTVSRFSHLNLLKRFKLKKFKLKSRNLIRARNTHNSTIVHDCFSLSGTLPPANTKVLVILPVYNEQSCIETTFDAVLEYARSHSNFHFLFVDDGSTDRTKQFLKSKLSKTDTEKIQLFSYRSRAGKGYAVKQGIAQADGDYICYLDSDLAYSLEHLEQLIAELQYFDIVIGCRSLASINTGGLSLNRKITGKVFNLLSRKLLDLPYRDMQAGLKGFRREAAKNLFSRQKMAGFSFDVELMYLARKYAYSIQEIPAVVSNHHQHKRSKVNLFSDSFKMLLNLIEIKLNDLKGAYD